MILYRWIRIFHPFMATKNSIFAITTTTNQKVKIYRHILWWRTPKNFKVSQQIVSEMKCCNYQILRKAALSFTYVCTLFEKKWITCTKNISKLIENIRKTKLFLDFDKVKKQHIIVLNSFKKVKTMCINGFKRMKTK